MVAGIVDSAHPALQMRPAFLDAHGLHHSGGHAGKTAPIKLVFSQLCFIGCFHQFHDELAFPLDVDKGLRPMRLAGDGQSQHRWVLRDGRAPAKRRHMICSVGIFRGTQYRSGWLQSEDHFADVLLRKRCFHFSYRCTRPDALPPARDSTSATEHMLKSCSTLCFRQEAATAKSMVFCWS